MAFIFVFLSSFLVVVEGFEKLGSSKPAECEPLKYECPSHMLCLAPNYSDAGHCVCDRFLGFFGPQCRGRSRATWLLFTFCIALSYFAVLALLSNITLALEMKKTGRLKPNCIGRTLFFNTLMPVCLLSHYLGYAAMLLELDPDMKYQKHGRGISLSVIFFLIIMDCLSISVVWIIDVQQAAAMRAGASSTRTKKRQERGYLVGLYIFSLSAASLVVYFYATSDTPLRGISLVGILVCACIGASYHFAGRRVLAHLRVADEHMLASQVNYTSIVANIRNTSKAMTRLTFGIVASFVGAALTVPSSAPIYPAQNSLPRLLQGQIFFFTANACTLGIAFHIVAYMRCGGRKQPSHRIKVNGQNLSNESSSRSNSSQLRYSSNSRSSLQGPRSSGSWASEEDAAKRRARRVRFSQQPELSENAKNLQDSIKYPLLPSAGTQPFMLVILATLQPPNSGKNSSQQSATQNAERTSPNESSDDVISQGCCRVSCTAVMDMGDGVLRDVDSKFVGNEAARVLSKGSHAFVECYGERYLRCAWHAFDFGFAGGHSLLADSGRVLLSGEIEVDASGNVTRWLMSQCGLSTPPRWAVVHSGLPITSAWAFIAGPELDALSSPDCNKEALIAEGILERLNETTPTMNSSPRVGALTPQTPFGASGPNKSPQDERISSSPVGTFSNASGDISFGMTRPTNDPDHEINSSIGSSNQSRLTAAETGASVVVPSRTIHAEDTWVMKLGDDFEWHVSVSQSLYAGIQEALASCTTFARGLARGCKLRFQRSQRPSHRHRVSPDLEEGWGLDDVGVGWLVDFEDKDDKAKDNEECRDATQAHLQGGIDAGISSDFLRCQRVSLPTHQVNLEMVLESTKEGSVIANEDSQRVSEEKEGESAFVDAASPTTGKLDQSSSSSSSSSSEGRFGSLKLGKDWVENRDETDVRYSKGLANHLQLEGEGGRLELNKLKNTSGYSKHLELSGNSSSTTVGETEPSRRGGGGSSSSSSSDAPKY